MNLRVCKDCDNCPYYKFGYVARTSHHHLLQARRTASQITVSGATQKCKICKKPKPIFELWNMWKKYKFFPFVNFPAGKVCKKCADKIGMEVRDK